MYFPQPNDGKKRPYVINTRPLPTNGGLKLMAQCVASADGIDLRVLWPYAKNSHVKGVTGF